MTIARHRVAARVCQHLYSDVVGAGFQVGGEAGGDGLRVAVEDEGVDESVAAAVGDVGGAKAVALNHAQKVPSCGDMPLRLDDQQGDAPVAEGEPEVQIDEAAGEVAFEVVDGGVVLVIDLLGADEFDGVRVFAG